jgi:hypothetical protein
LFEKLSIQQQRTTDAESPLDLASLAEALLFYGSVEVVINRTSLRQMVRDIEPDVLLELVNRGHLNLRFESNFTGIVTEQTGTPAETHAPTVFKIERQELLDILRPAVIAAVGKEGRGRRLALKLDAQIRNTPIDEKLAARFAEDLTAPDYLPNAVRLALQLNAPEIRVSEELRFEAIPIGDNRFRIETNLDFNILNEIYHRHVPASHSSLSPAYLLSQLLHSRKILEDAAHDDAELAVAPLYETLISSRIHTALSRRAASANEIAAFQQFIFDNGRSVAAVLASKERTFADLLPILEKASKFRGWLRERELTASLVKEYFRAVTEKSWMDKLPTKAVRWSIFTTAGLAIDAIGAGGIGTAGGVLLSAVDALFVDKILQGWKPNQFIENSLSDFVQS